MRSILSVRIFFVAAVAFGCAISAYLPPYSALAQQSSDFPKVFNTEAEGEFPPAAEEMVKLIELPPGFKAALFAGDPDVQQPICMDFDDRGRLWVAENYTYSGGPYETKLRDRVVILEDTDGDGRHDKRTIFWDKGFMLTSLTWGHGGLWILHDGTLSLIPDKNGDDIPDGEPLLILDGWSKECGHNFVSGLIWGPDGWLYGRHGIVDTSYPGVPGTPQAERPAMNCGVWRYHPIHRSVEVVCSGTTNPWGLDYNADGQFFMTNNVQGHLWHCLPGAHFKRMYGQDFNPHLYELMDMTADHYHWDTTRKWNESRDGVANDLGGGHSHVGGLIYQGTNFPAEYRGKIFMCNTHGRRLNVNRLERAGSGFVGKREPDFMLVKTPWFRGVDIKAGPDGAMYVADWSDNGECHDHDGIHRTSGRIYRITYGTPIPFQPKQPLAEQDSAALLALVQAEDAWHARHALRILQERQQTDAKLTEVPQQVAGKPLSILTVEALGLLNNELLLKWLKSSDAEQLEHAVQLAASTIERRQEFLPDLVFLAKQKPATNVLMALISVLRRLENAERLELATAIVSQPENAQRIAGELNLTLMAWYGIEPAVKNIEVVKLLQSVPKLQQFAVRRLAYEIQPDNQLTSDILQMVSGMVAQGDDADAAGLITAFRTGLAGRARIDPPKDWAVIEKQLRKSKNSDIAFAIDALGVLFGDGAALADLRKLAKNADEDIAAREEAIKALAQAKDTEAVSVYLSLLGDRAVADAAIRALASFDNPNIAKELIKRMGGFKDGNRSLAFDTLASRQTFALELIGAIDAGQVSASDLSAAQVRQLLAFSDPQIRKVIEAKWGVVQETPEAKVAAMDRWRKTLTPETLAAANLENGMQLFKKSCASCHKLYGEGLTIGPDLTGANRTNLDYLLMNIIDPSAVVPKQFTTSIIALESDRVITGVIVGQTEKSVTIQTDKEQLTIAKEEIKQSRDSGKSLMPDGMLDSLTPEQVRDLFGFIMQRR
jgi:putative membrane-bound dehydrogenase-like protein